MLGFRKICLLGDFRLQMLDFRGGIPGEGPESVLVIIIGITGENLKILVT